MDNHEKHSLGSRAFAFFLLKRSKVVLFLLALTAAAWYAERWIPADYQTWGQYVGQFLLLLSGIYLLIVLTYSYLEYHYYTFMFTEEAFIMNYGYIIRQEVAALYHQIQNVNINRGPLDRMTGVSQIVIFMTGSEQGSGHNKIILPTVGKAKAKMVQKELLTRARRHIVPGVQAR